MTKETEMHKAPAAEIEDIRVEDEMEQSYIDYAMSVIVGRSIPDVRDGMKPVQRRILYTMSEQLGITHNSSHVKSANVVGKTMGEYHPHGDSAIYDALARMSQNFSLRYPLVDGQGNFGSVDGDPPAAMRYTEARLGQIGEEMLEDIGADTVDFSSNYDDRLQEPDVLPSKFPNLLANGGSGIAVGLSTKIPSHNIEELVDATKHLIDNPECNVEGLMDHMPGPDFPLGGKIVGRDGIYNAYSTGRGKLRVRADYRVEDEGKDHRIIITELPPETNKSRMLRKIADLVDKGTIEGVSDLRDESNREDGVRVVVELKRNAIADVVENQLVDKVLESTFGVINLSIVDGEPRVLTLKETLEHWLDHRKEVVRRRAEDELRDKEYDAHLLKGRITALENTESVVEIIRGSEDRDEAVSSLMAEYDFSEDQATHIVRMQLGSLTSMEINDVRTEHEEVTSRIARLNEILNDEQEILDIIKEELTEVKVDYGDERRTEIIDATNDVTREDLIPQEDILITLTEDGYVKRTNAKSFKQQQRGGKGITGTQLKSGDSVTAIAAASTHDRLLCFTSKGNVYEKKGYQLPEYTRTARGEPDVTVFDKLEEEEHVTEIMSAPETFDSDHQLTLLTKNGRIKQTTLSEFDNILSTGIKAITLQNGDEIVDAEITADSEDVLIGKSDGRAIRFSLTDVSETGRTSQGVNAVQLDDETTVTKMVTTGEPETTDSLAITENGYGKRTKFNQYRQQSRYGKGVLDIKTNDRNGLPRTIEKVSTTDEETDLVVISKDGNIVRMNPQEISQVSRNTKGVNITSFESEVVDAAILE
jgi:DNA gyrase subunit A